MKNIWIIFLALIFSFCKQNKSTIFHNNPVIAHRGAWKNTGAPQNSLASLRVAIAMKCHGSEFDVHLTADDSLIVYHDRDHHGMKIDSTNYADLIKIPLENNEKIPTLREYLEPGLAQHQTKLIVDIKTPDNEQRALHVAEQVFSLIKQLKAESQVEFLTFDISVAEYLLEACSVPVAYLGAYTKISAYMSPDSINEKGYSNVDYWYKHYQRNVGWVNIFKEKGVKLNAWTVNSAKDMNWFLERGFDYITTDEPELLLKLHNNMVD